MEQNKNKKKSKLTIVNINKGFGFGIFVLVFVFTFLVTSKELKSHWVIITAVFGGVITAVVIAWVVLYFVLKNKQYKEDPNKQKIDKALEKLKEDRKKHESDSKLI